MPATDSAADPAGGRLLLAAGGLRAWQVAGGPRRAAVQDLRDRAFLRNRGLVRPEGDRDRFDAQAVQVLIEEAATGAPLAAFRALIHGGGEGEDCGAADGQVANDRSATGLTGGYCAQFYALDRLAALPGVVVELGRVCTDPARRADPDVLRMTWAAVATLVDGSRARMLLGCSSFEGTDPSRHAHAFALLAARHLGPRALMPERRAPLVHQLGQAVSGQRPALRRGLAQMPPLLRSYLAMGAWVSDHAVIDRDLDTLHVLTVLEVATIPPARRKLLRTIAQTARVAAE